MFTMYGIKKHLIWGMVGLLVGGLIFSCIGCDPAPPPPPPPAKPEKTEPPPATEDGSEEEVAGDPTPSYTYDPSGRREPFESLVVATDVAAEDVVVTPPPEELTSPLQRYDIKQIQIVGIILGGLGDYAKVRAPDGESYTISVGTLMGPHQGKVISISENVILVKETIRYESGTEEVVETPLYLNPEEEGKQ